MPRQISAHIELAGVSWWRDWLRSSKKLQFIAKLRRAFQRTCQTARADSVLPSSSIDFSLAGTLRIRSAHLRLGDHASDYCYDARPLAKFVRESLAFGIRCREFVQQEKTGRDDEYVKANLGQLRTEIRMQIPRTTAAAKWSALGPQPERSRPR